MLGQKVLAGSEGTNSVQRDPDLILKSNACRFMVELILGVGILARRLGWLHRW